MGSTCTGGRSNVGCLRRGTQRLPRSVMPADPANAASVEAAGQETSQVPVIFYLSGLTCTAQNALTKAGFATDGKSELHDGRTGEAFTQRVTVVNPLAPGYNSGRSRRGSSAVRRRANRSLSSARANCMMHA